MKECKEKIVKLEEKFEKMERWRQIEEEGLSRTEESEQDDDRSVVSDRSRRSSRWMSMEYRER